MNRIYLIGNGYVCDFITEKYSCDYEFVGVCRSEKNNCKHNYSIDISTCTHELNIVFRDKGDVVYLAAPQASGVEDHTLRNFLSSVDKSKINRLVYISTSGVYGDKKDQLVDEKSKLEPITDRAKRRVNAEEQIINSGIDYTILRVPGIYGRGRLPMKRVDSNLPLIREDICKHTNLINAKDLAKIIIQCFTQRETMNIVMNVSDGTPIKTTKYYLHIYDALKLNYPKFIDYKEANELYDDKRRSFINESRILDVSLMDSIFPDIIDFKDIREGIKDCLN
jgi:nucleoside-diphosphate-sugar epimerase